jgi:hypothetical protein
MKYPVLILLSLIFFCLSCDQPNRKEGIYNLRIVKKPVVLHNYKETGIPQFLQTFVANHLNSFMQLDSAGFSLFCKTNELNPNDTQNTRQYFTIDIVHKLFTSRTAQNGSVGGILPIPYYWHWVTPNPRYDIY